MRREEGSEVDVMRLPACSLFILLFPLPSVFTSLYRVIVSILSKAER